MYPTSHEYHLQQIERLTTAFATIPTQKQSSSVTPTTYIAAGEPIFSGHESTAKPYLVTSGEILILRNGQPVDLLEPGDLLDLHIWADATAVALNSCTLTALSGPVFKVV